MKYFWFVLIMISNAVFGQKNIQLSPKSEISILTCAPGVNDLHAYFGHNAIRVKDPIHHIDKIYNYGTFDFKTPNFYLKFCRGQLLYQVVSYPYKYFPGVYYKENRWVKSQVLNLSQSQNQKIFNFLEWNILPENKDYKYDFFYDNCSTKIEEILQKLPDSIQFNYDNFPKKLSHRDLIHQYLQKNSWAKFGIDLALGSVIDREANFNEYLFLPDYNWSALHNATINGSKLIRKENYILPNNHLTFKNINFFTSPIFVSIILLILSLLSFLKKGKIGSIWDNMFITILGTTGIIITLLWFFTEHSTTKNNFNILWANPLFLMLFLFKNNLKVNYLMLISLLSFFVVGIFGIQQFNIAFYIIALSATIVILKKLLPFKV